MKTESNYINIKIIVLVCLLYLFNIISIQTPALAAAFAIIQFATIVYLCIFKPKYFYYTLLLFLAGSFDIGEFVGGENYVTYNLASLPFVAGYVWLCFILIIYISRRFSKTLIRTISKYPSLLKFVKVSDFIIIIGFLSGLFSIITNDNNILNINWIKYFLYDFTAYSIAPIMGVLLVYEICKYGKRYVFSLQQLVIAILVSIPVCSLAGAILGLSGTYGYGEILLSPLTLFFCPMIIFFVFYKKYNMKKWSIAAFSLCMFLQFTHSNALGGKSWLSLLYILVVSLFILYQQGQKKIVRTAVILIIALSGAIVGFIKTSIDNNKNNAVTTKLQQAVLLLSFADELWYSNIPASPKTRIEEFINIILEYKEKPYFAILGKGFGGSTKDNMPFTQYKGEGAFSDDQFDNHSFIFLHESINNVFLKFGYVGLIYFLAFIIKLLKNIKETPWGGIGAIWVFLFYGYSIVLCVFGTTCLILSLYFSPSKQRRLSIHE